MGVKIREHPAGSNTWWVFINHHGRRKSKKIGSDRTKAEEVAKKIEARLVLGDFGFIQAPSKCPTFQNYAEQWLAVINDRNDRKESTVEAYRNVLRLHAYPVFGKLRLDQIGRKDLKAFMEKLLLSGHKLATVLTVKTPISMILNHATESEIIHHNPIKDIKLSVRKKRLEVYPLGEKEIEIFLAQAKIYLQGFYYPHFLCALRTGMRIGEIQALQWGDIDFNGRFIEVRRSWRLGRLTDTKNRRRRQVDMTVNLGKTLKALQVSQKKRALKAGHAVPEWVFANRKGEMLCRLGFGNALSKCLEKAGLRRIRVHDLRHTYATIRLLRGHNIGDVSYQLGHSSISITYDLYGHWLPGKFKSEVEDLDKPHLPASYTHPGYGPLEILK